ncbi:protein phosphatase regulator BUD14 Ecym_5254 [Eremothecium cymbalariae DBVPG|uniref:SH3 domain-containing protein n=1 Tax=Eremothecium cymbalariae (strain CBS 270.75 / DBVPG 7215 / KCTC 17166 / NRRL Y-17582) TaxID=931890 RepID=I6ND78_ERECY|nr:hypothetical protein Ecym_5254 [Eremothecium cymbalariae DBVPG\
MPNFLDRAYDRYSASQGGSKLSSHHKSLLLDPSLVEDYQDIMLQLPNGGNAIRTDDELSANGSVVVMSPPETPERKRESVLLPEGTPESEGGGIGNQPVLGSPLKHTILASEVDSVEPKAAVRAALRNCNGKMGGTQPRLLESDAAGKRLMDASAEEAYPDGQGSSAVEVSRTDDGNEHDEINKSSEYDDEDDEYCYSDSDFEESLEGRLREMESVKQEGRALQEKNRPNVLSVGGGDSAARGVSNFRANSYSDAPSDEELDEISSSEELSLIKDDDEDIDDYLPLPPPQELDPGKLYALYPFQGPDPSHCQLDQDQGCVLLNDQDSYWWLVRRCVDGKIGFAPAEILETFPERLARLNCWKNENMSTQSLFQLNQKEDSPEHKNDADSSQLKSYEEGNKSVSFNDVVSYAERYYQPSKAQDQVYANKHEDDEQNISFHVDEIHHTRLNDHDMIDEDISDVLSEAPASSEAMVPLNIKKVRNNNTENNSTDDVPQVVTPPNSEPAKNKDDELKQIFKAPILPFSNSRAIEIPSSNSHNSISTIGEYSPSSSEYTNDSPQFDSKGKFIKDNQNNAIPTARAIQDISRLVSTPTDETLQNPTDDEQILVSTPQISSSSSGSTTELRTNITNTESEESFLDIPRNEHNSLSSVTSTQSIGKYGHHPVVHELYNPVFDKIEDLLEKLEKFKTSPSKLS